MIAFWLEAEGEGTMEKASETLAARTIFTLS